MLDGGWYFVCSCSVPNPIIFSAWLSTLGNLISPLQIDSMTASAIKTNLVFFSLLLVDKGATAATVTAPAVVSSKFRPLFLASVHSTKKCLSKERLGRRRHDRIKFLYAESAVPRVLPF